MSIEMRNRIKVLESKVAELERRLDEPSSPTMPIEPAGIFKDIFETSISTIESRLIALESKPRRGRPPRDG